MARHVTRNAAAAATRVAAARVAAALLIVAGLASCATRPATDDPPPIDATPVVRSLVLCTTTFDSLRTALGAPSRDGLLHGQRVVSWVTAWKPLVRYLAVLVDSRGVVVDVYWDMPSEVPWTPQDQCHVA